MIHIKAHPKRKYLQLWLLAIDSEACLVQRAPGMSWQSKCGHNAILFRTEGERFAAPQGILEQRRGEDT